MYAIRSYYAGQEKGAAEHDQTAGVGPAWPDPVERHADEGRCETADQQVKGIDAGQARPAPAELGFERPENVITSYSIHYTKLYEWSVVRGGNTRN